MHVPIMQSWMRWFETGGLSKFAWKFHDDQKALHGKNNPKD